MYKRFMSVVLPNNTGNKYNAKKEERITGGIPEEKPREVVAQTEIEGGAGKIEPKAEEKGFRKQL